MKWVLFLACWLVSDLLVAQTFTIKRMETAGGKIYLYYDLIDTVVSRSYTVALFSSSDNFITPVQKVTGDVGLQVRPGSGKKIVWNAKEELPVGFDGQVSLEVRGRLYVPFVQLDGFNKTVKRVNPTEITWTGGSQQNVLNFDLYRGEEKIITFPDIANVGHYSLKVPMSVKPGNDYRLKISDSRNKDQVVFSDEFRIVRKTPIFLKAIPLAGIGVFAAMSLSSSDSGPKLIPDPIKP